jgi:very-short-patch-repair endonuclease
MHLTDPHIRERARRMRQHPTASEAKLWSWLRGRRFAHFKFRRQYAIGSYIIDFYCDELKPAIEVDGAQHEILGVVEVDAARTETLRGYGIELIRISNRLIATDVSMAAQRIQWAIDRAVKRRSTRI